MYFSFEVKDPALAKVLTRTPEELNDWLRHAPFEGRLEVDGFAIDAQSPFREISRGVSAERRMHCGMSDCSNSADAFGEHGNLYLTLDGQSDNSLLRRFTMEV